MSLQMVIHYMISWCN